MRQRSVETSQSGSQRVAWPGFPRLARDLIDFRYIFIDYQ
jgi:hypothetical protein